MLKCCIVRDLLPTYIDGLTSEETETQVKAHLQECSECSKLFEQLKVPIENTDLKTEDREINYLKKIKLNNAKRLGIVIATILFTFTILSYLFVIGSPVKKKDMEYTQSVVNNQVLINFKLTNGKDMYSKYEILIDNKDKKVNEIDVENMVPPSTPTKSSSNMEIPEVVKNYQAPSGIGDDLYSFQVKYGGNYYKLPIPIPELVKNGWVLQSNGDEIIAAKDGVVGIELRKDNQVLRTQIENYSDKGTPVKYCFVTYIEYYNNGAEIPLELPKGISEKSTIDEIFGAYGEPAKIEESSTFKYYIYGEIFEQIVFMTNNGKIEKIEVSYSPKTLE